MTQENKHQNQNNSSPDGLDTRSTPSRTSDGEVQHQNRSEPQNNVKSSDIWASIGKVGTVLGVILGSLAIWNAANPKGPRIQAVCEVVSLEIVGRFLDEEAKERQRNREAAEEKAKGKSKLSDSGVKTIFVYHPLREGLGSTSEKALINCRLQNYGTEPAEDVVVDLTRKPTRILIGDMQVSSKETSASIKLGTMRPGPDVKIAFTSDDFGVSFRPEALAQMLHVSFKGGRGELQVGSTHFGFAAQTASFLTAMRELWFVLLIFLPLVWVIVNSLQNIILASRKASQKSQESS